MRAALETVAEFLSKYGALEEANNIMNVMAKMGWSVPADSKLQWRSLVAAMKQELNAPEAAPDYVFLFERLIQLCIKMPGDLWKSLFSSKLLMHIVVERFAIAFESHDAELFKLESDVLCHTEGIFDICQLVQNKLFSEDVGTSVLAQFLADFSTIFEDDEPKVARWDEFYSSYRMHEASFRRDMKRALCQIEASGIGPTQIEIRKRIRREAVEGRFPGTSGDLSDSTLSEPEDSTCRVQNSSRNGPPVTTNSAAAASPPPVADQQETAPSDSASAEDSPSPKVRAKRKRWSTAEVEALRKGYKEFRALPNVWMMIKTKYADVLASRSNVDIKDKYRNLLKFGKL
uniref:Myb-like domain-containing protein n=1 Tax=Globisporangium ultimum (strain ATCC 200006 / CBS 805.95 / DAOM BR144) TaxID=431595 RepID=K3WLK5_GLOUD